MTKTPRPVRGILIDPFKCEITEVEHNAADYTNIYPLISHESMPVSTFTIVHLGDDSGDAIFIDDDGLLKPCDRFFVISGFPQPLAGRGLILGCNGSGKTVDAKVALETIRRNVRFAEHIDDNFRVTSKPWEPA